MAGADSDDSLYPIAVLIDELRNEDVQVKKIRILTPTTNLRNRLELVGLILARIAKSNWQYGPVLV